MSLELITGQEKTPKKHKFERRSKVFLPSKEDWSDFYWGVKSGPQADLRKE